MLCRGLAHLMLDPVLEIWDVAALIPCARGTGAAVSDWFGGGKFGREGGFIAACSKELLDETVSILNAKY